MEYEVIRDGWIKIPYKDWFPQHTDIRRDRLLLGLNQLLVRINGKTILVDTGIGTKWGKAETGLLDCEYPRKLLQELAKVGVTPADVDIVILSHLHFDHSGGATNRINDTTLATSFTNALYYLQGKELRAAQAVKDVSSDDYRHEDYEPLIASGQLMVIEGDVEVMYGVNLYLVAGHSEGHQVALFSRSGRSLFYPGDLFSTREHCNLNVVSVYDANSELLLKNRKRWLKTASNNRWDTFFCHSIRDTIGIIEQL